MGYHVTLLLLSLLVVVDELPTLPAAVAVALLLHLLPSA
jgi:hypothetical protein